MARERPAASDQVLPGRIEKVLFAGSETKYLVRVGHDSLWEVRMMSGAYLPPFAQDEPVFLHWCLADGRLFFE